MVKCSFCGFEVEKGTGTTKIMKDGKILPLCSNKCHKNMFKLGRIPREIQWTAEYKAVKTMRMTTAQHQKAEKKEIKSTAKKLK